jgi:superoxide reductase
MSVKFYRCEECGNIVELINNGGGELVCCGQPMVELKANTTDAANEKHVPVVEKQDGKLVATVGAVEHPMTDAHYIQWIAAVTDKGIFRVNLTPSDKPKAVFTGLNVKEVYEYCNLHGLWKTEV